MPGVTEGRSVPGTVAPALGTLRAALLLVHSADAPADESTEPPVETLTAAAAWFRAVSYGRLDLRATTVPRWLPLPSRAAEYIADPARYLRDAVAAADPYVDFSEVDVVYLAPALRTPETATSAILNGFGVRADGKEIGLWIPFGAGFAAESGSPALLLHETGHLLGLPDLYTAGSPNSFHRWDLMASRWPSELLAWHRWKLEWLDPSQIVCIAGRSKRTTAVLTPLERAGGRKAIFVRRGNRVLVVEIRARAGYDEGLCETGVLVYEVDQTPFRRTPVRIYSAQSNSNPPKSGCAAQWNAPLDAARREIRTLRLPGFRVDVLAKRSGGGYRVRVTT